MAKESNRYETYLIRVKEIEQMPYGTPELDCLRRAKRSDLEREWNQGLANELHSSVYGLIREAEKHKGQSPTTQPPTSG
jgi:hypothetical protein